MAAAPAAIVPNSALASRTCSHELSLETSTVTPLAICWPRLRRVRAMATSSAGVATPSPSTANDSKATQWSWSLTSVAPWWGKRPWPVTVICKSPSPHPLNGSRTSPESPVTATDRHWSPCTAATCAPATGWPADITVTGIVVAAAGSAAG